MRNSQDLPARCATGVALPEDARKIGDREARVERLLNHTHPDDGRLWIPPVAAGIARRAGKESPPLVVAQRVRADAG